MSQANEIAEFVKSLRDAGLNETEIAAAIKAKMESDRSAEEQRQATARKAAEIQLQAAVAGINAVVALEQLRKPRKKGIFDTVEDTLFGWM